MLSGERTEGAVERFLPRVSPHMAFQVISLFASITAVGMRAGVRFLFGMSRQMCFQMNLLLSSVVAQMTLEWLLTWMDIPHVYRDLPRPFRFKWAETALEWFVITVVTLVGLKFWSLIEGMTAARLWTFEGFLPCMSSEVSRQVTPLSGFVVAQRALVGFLTCMNPDVGLKLTWGEKSLLTLFADDPRHNNFEVPTKSKTWAIEYMNKSEMWNQNQFFLNLKCKMFPYLLIHWSARFQSESELMIVFVKLDKETLMRFSTLGSLDEYSSETKWS
jgi:hypothetical protein